VFRKAHWHVVEELVSISPTFTVMSSCFFPLAICKKILTQTVSTKKLKITLPYENLREKRL